AAFNREDAALVCTTRIVAIKGCPRDTDRIIGGTVDVDRAAAAIGCLIGHEGSAENGQIARLDENRAATFIVVTTLGDIAGEVAARNGRVAASDVDRTTIVDRSV